MMMPKTARATLIWLCCWLAAVVTRYITCIYNQFTVFDNAAGALPTTGCNAMSVVRHPTDKVRDNLLGHKAENERLFDTLNDA
jgi:hypothetical protein